jgi:hypothetical protein
VRDQRAAQRDRIEVRPQALREHDLGVRALPQEEVGEPLLAPAADEQVDVRHALDPGTRTALGEQAREAFATAAERLRDVEALRRADDRVASRVVDREAQVELRPRRGELLGELEHLEQVVVDAVATPDDLDAHAALGDLVHVLEQVALEQVEDVVRLVVRPVEALRREREQGQRADAARGSGAHDLLDGVGAGAVPGCTRLLAHVGPTRVAVHDERHVEAGGARDVRSTLQHKAIPYERRRLGGIITLPAPP